MVMIFEAPRGFIYELIDFLIQPLYFLCIQSILFPTPSYERRINRKSGSLPHEAVGYNQIGHHSITVANANTFWPLPRCME